MIWADSAFIGKSYCVDAGEKMGVDSTKRISDPEEKR